MMDPLHVGVDLDVAPRTARATGSSRRTSSPMAAAAVLSVLVLGAHVPARAQTGDGGNADEAVEPSPGSEPSSAGVDADGPAMAATSGESAASSSGGTEESTDAEAPQEQRGPHEVDPNRLEIVGLPFLTFISEIGLLVGVVGSLTKFRPGSSPYAWNMTVALSVGLGLDARSNVFSPLQRLEVILRMPSLLQNRLRVNVGVFSEAQSNLAYFGLGNASINVGSPQDPPTDFMPAPGQEGLFQQYERTYTALRVDSAYRLGEHWFVSAGVWFHFLRHLPYEDSKLLRDWGTALGQDDPTLRGLEDYLGIVPSVGLILDTRDDELNPNDGVFAEASIRGGAGFTLGPPGGAAQTPGPFPNINWGSFYVNVRGFVDLYPGWLVLAMRAVADMGFGDLPLFEMTRVGAYTQFIGPSGEQANRGLPAGRLHGRVKLVGNAELRFTFWRTVTGAGIPLRLGLILFTDVTRVWSRWVDAEPGLDGGFFLWPSVGGGFRFGWGEAATLRLDVGVAPDGGADSSASVGVAFSANHLF
ncbi:MAG: BamA/TamA family outer membrane protein [Sandaracinaceae bacterium]